MIGKNKVILKEETWGEEYYQRIFASASLGPTKKAKFSVVMLEGEEGGVVVVWVAKVVILLRLKSRKGVRRGKLCLCST